MPNWLQTLLEQIYSAPGYYIAGAVLILIGIWLGRPAADMLDRWSKALNKINANHEHKTYDAPLHQTWRGITGCFWGIVLRFFQLLLILLGIDLFLQGTTINRLFNAVSNMLSF